MVPKKIDCYVQFKICINREQSRKLTASDEAVLLQTIQRWTQLDNSLFNFRPVRCNLENPIREGKRSLFFGIIVVGGNVPYGELSSTAWSSKLLELRTKIRQHVVEVSGIRFSRIRTVRGARGKLKD